MGEKENCELQGWKPFLARRWREEGISLGFACLGCVHCTKLGEEPCSTLAFSHMSSKNCTTTVCSSLFSFHRGIISGETATSQKNLFSGSSSWLP